MLTPKGLRPLLVVAAVMLSTTVSCASGGQAPDAATSAAPVAASNGRGIPIVALDARAVAAWTTVNDPVMGGESTATVGYGDGGLVFAGTVSLENDGGFASARSPRDTGIGQRATGATTLRVDAVGDGKTYLVKAYLGGERWSYIQRFRTEAGVRKAYELPVADFEPVGERLKPAPDAPRTLDPAHIDQVALYILDGQQGPFTLTVSAIDAVT